MVHETSWTLVKAAAEGSEEARSVFARTYESLVRAYLATRWRHSALLHELDDGVQNVFVECFRPRGVVDQAQVGHPGGFRRYLLGATRHVALMMERSRVRRRQGAAEGDFHPEEVCADDTSLARAFDRAWARALIQEATRMQRQEAQHRGDGALQRIEILRLRFGEDRPIRLIAQDLGMDPGKAHHEYAQARREFKNALKKVIAIHGPCAPGRLEEEYETLLSLLRT